MTMPSYCCPQTVKRPLKSRWEAAGSALSLRGFWPSSPTALSGPEIAQDWGRLSPDVNDWAANSGRIHFPASPMIALLLFIILMVLLFGSAAVLSLFNGALALGVVAFLLMTAVALCAFLLGWFFLGAVALRQRADWIVKNPQLDREKASGNRR
jgi:hypothetical protein